MPITDKRREYLRTYQKAWLQRRRKEFFDGKACVKCGSTERLELDHIDRSQKWTHSIWSYSKEKREAEQAKCQVICYHCHKAKTYVDMGYGYFTHGKYSSYKKYGCRCEACKKIYSVKTKEYRAKRKALGLKYN